MHSRFSKVLRSGWSGFTSPMKKAPVGKKSAATAMRDGTAAARAAHRDAEYDFELDTIASPVRELARELYESYQACPQPTAFDRLRKRFLP